MVFAIAPFKLQHPPCSLRVGYAPLDLLLNTRYLILEFMTEHKLFDGQHDDERVQSVFRRHPVVMRKGLLALLIFWVGGLLPYSFWFYTSWAMWVLIAGLVLGVVVMFWYWIGWYFSINIVSDQRLVQITQEGLFKRTVVDIGLEKILSINYQIAGIEQTVLGFGTIIVQTYVGDLVLEYIHHPQKVQSTLVNVIKENGYEYRGEQAKEAPDIKVADKAKR